MSQHTGPFPKSKIDRVAPAQRAAQKTFKGGRDTSAEWLTKRNSVRQTHQEFYTGKASSSLREHVSQPDGRYGKAARVADPMSPSAPAKYRPFGSTNGAYPTTRPPM